MVEVMRTDPDALGVEPPAGARLGSLEVEVDGTPLRLAHVELGPAGGEPIVLLHGEPTYSHLWRHVMPPLAEAGLRVIAPDLVGFGRSDKPTELDWYTHERLGAALSAHLDALAPDRLTLVVHDWGGVLGLPWAVAHAERVARLVITDTGLYSRGGFPSESWRAFRDFVERTEVLPIGRLVDGGTTRELSEAERAAYEAPFPDGPSQAGARALPLLVPVTDDDPGAELLASAREALGSWEAPTLVVWGAEDPVLPPAMGEAFARHVPGCVGLELLEGAGHFLQEDAGERLGQRIARFVTDGT